jgi:ADP-ribosyl-[dinitrogen reductase] hydrolase
LLADRVAGVLWGLAAGDRIGGPIRMALCVAESLAAVRGFDPADIGRRYLDWWRASGFDTGPVAAAVFRLVVDGSSWDEAAAQVDRRFEGMTAGCNPAHRSAPLAIAPWLPTDALVEMARVEAALTHRHPEAGEVASAVVKVCRLLAEGQPWSPSLVAPFQPVAAITGDGYAPNVLRAAVHFLEHSPTFETALESALDFAGPANYCPVLVGSIGGARFGRSAIPERLLAHVDDGVASRIESVLAAL